MTDLPKRTALPAEFGGTPQPAPAVTIVGDATDKQLDYLRSLAEGREIAEEHRADLLKRIEERSVTKARASDWISRLLEKPKRAGASNGRFGRFPVRFETLELDGGKRMELGFVDVDGKEVPQGKYALDVSDLDWANDLAFFNLYVARGNDGPFYSLKMYVSDDLVKMNAENQREILRRVALDPAAASRLYGQHKVRCGVCNRKLTNDLSREIGIGPVCRERLSW